MGAWDTAPWDNDAAADWFDDLFKKTKLAEHVRKELQGDPQERYEEIRAAASLVLMLGRPYVWPIEQMDQDLALAASKLEQLLSVPELKESEELTAAIREEIQELRSRIKGSNVQPPAGTPEKKWWQFWK